MYKSINFVNLILKIMKSYEKNQKGKDLDANDKSNCDLIKSKIEENLIYMKQISDTFPRQNGYLLNFICFKKF